MSLHPNTLRALERLDVRYDEDKERVIIEEAFEFRDPSDPSVTYYEPPVFLPAVQRSDGRWVSAEWDNNHAQWKSYDLHPDFLRANPNARYVFARRLENLLGCRVYRSLPELVRAFI